MSVEALLTLLGLVVAAYAIVPTERRLDFRVRLTSVDWFAIAIAVLLVHYISFIEVFESVGLGPRWGTWRWGFGPSSATYGIIVATGLAVGLHTRFSQIPCSKLPLLRRLVGRLMQEGKYADARYLVENHRHTILRAQRGDYFRLRLRNWLVPERQLEMRRDAEAGTITVRQRRPSGYLQKGKHYIGSRLPRWTAIQESARDVLHRVLTSKQFVTDLARSHPYLGIELGLRTPVERERFLELYIGALLEDRSSVLYYEINNNGVLVGGGNRYRLEEKNQLLFALLKDAHVAEDVGAWKPFGDWVASDLSRRAALGATDRYNQPYRRFDDEEKTSDPIWITIRFFDLMVEEALHQGIEYHMWLYYFPSFARQIVENYDPAPDVELDREFPTPYHFFLYELTSTLRSWIEEVEHLHDAPNVKLESEEAKHENENIPKSAMLAYAQVLRTVLATDKLSDEFKVYLLEGALRTNKSLVRNKNTAAYAVAFQNALVAGGPSMYTPDRAHARRLRAFLEDVDVVLKIEDSTEELLKKLPA